MLIYQDLVIIDKKYLDYLHSFDSRVALNHENTKDRPNVAVLVDDNGQKWAIPLSHSKKLKNNDTVFHLVDNKKTLGHLKFNNMIPIVEGTYISAFGVYDQKYDQLLYQEQNIIKKVFYIEIEPRFKKVLKLYNDGKKLTLKNNPSKEDIEKYEKRKKFYDIFNDFDNLLKASKKWSNYSK